MGRILKRRSRRDEDEPRADGHKLITVASRREEHADRGLRAIFMLNVNFHSLAHQTKLMRAKTRFQFHLG